MQLLLVRDVLKLGHVGDVVEVKPAYARNYLVPQRLGVEPTQENIDAIEADKKTAAQQRATRLKAWQDLAERLTDVSVTIESSANPEGTLYGSVGAEEIAAALQTLGHEVLPRQVALESPIRTIDNVNVPIRLTDEISTQVKVWVVREGADEHGDQADGPDDESDFEADDDSD